MSIPQSQARLALIAGAEDQIRTVLKDLRTFQPWNKRPFGSTGTFPQPKLDDDDQGGLRLGIAFDPVNGVIRMEFGKPVAWIGFAPEDAVQLAKSLLKAAGASKIEITL